MTVRTSDIRGTGALGPFRARLRQVTQVVVAVRRSLGEEGAELHAHVVGDLKAAFGDEEPSLEWIAVDGEPEPQACASTDGLFRMVLAEFGVDRSDLHAQETVFELVRRDLDEAIDEDAAGPTD